MWQSISKKSIRITDDEIMIVASVYAKLLSDSIGGHVAFILNDFYVLNSKFEVVFSAISSMLRAIKKAYCDKNTNFLRVQKKLFRRKLSYEIKNSKATGEL